MRLRRVSASIAILCLLVAGCGGSATPQAPAATAGGGAGGAAGGGAPAKLVDITVGETTIGALQWPFFVAEQQGFFKKEGLNPTFVLVDTNVKGAQGLISGSLQFSDGSPDPEFKADATQNAGLVVMGSATNSPVYRLVVPPSIKSFDDLRGKKVGVSASLSMDGIWMKDILQSHGLPPGSYEMVDAGGTSTRFQALTTGALSAAWLSQPQDFQALAAGMHSLAFSNEAMKEIIWSGYSVKASWAAAHRDIAVHFMAALAQAHRWLYDPKNRQAAIDLLASKTTAKPEQIGQTYDLWIQQKSLSDHGEKAQLAIDNMMKALVDSHQIPAALPASQVWDQSYLNDAMKQLGLS